MTDAQPAPLPDFDDVVDKRTNTAPTCSVADGAIRAHSLDPKLGRKFDSGKPRMSLLPSIALRSVLRVLEIGARKYAPENWRYVENARTRYYDAAHRHLTDWWDGEKLDPETGENHLAHAACCIFFLLALDLETVI